MKKFNEQFEKIMEGSVHDKIRKIDEQLLQLEAMKVNLTAGMLNGYTRTANLKASCDGCGLGIPKYRGRYPNYCPSCGETLEAGNKKTQDIEPMEEEKMNEENIIGVPKLLMNIPKDGGTIGDTKISYKDAQNYINNVYNKLIPSAKKWADKSPWEYIKHIFK